MTPYQPTLIQVAKGKENAIKTTSTPLPKLLMYVNI
jgi:hypothetical protein